MMEIIKKEVAKRKNQVKSLKNQIKEIRDSINSENIEFKNWIKHTFPAPNKMEQQVYSDSVSIYDDANIYRFNLQDGVLVLDKTPRRDGFARIRMSRHPFYMMDMYEDMMMNGGQPTNLEETFYEGGIEPESVKKEREYRINYYDLLKEDVLNKGIISTTIKDYFNETISRRKRSEKIQELEKDISNLCNGFSTEFMQHLVPELVKNNTVVEKSDLIIITLNNKHQDVMRFIKETTKQYIVEFDHINKKKEVTTTTKRFNKDNFYLHNYLKVKHDLWRVKAD